MNIAEKAYKELFPQREEMRNVVISYSGKFKEFNANVRYTNSSIHFNISKLWLDFSEDLRIGLIQHLFVKMFPKKKHEDTLELDLYLKFMKNVGRYAKLEHDDVELSESFKRMNKIYFDDLLDKPNLKWGQEATSKLGHYEYSTNTIVVSSLFRGEFEHLDFIMHHEMLHKKHGNEVTKSGRNIHHSRAFKEDEAKYTDKDAEKKLTKFLRRKKIRKALGF